MTDLRDFLNKYVNVNLRRVIVSNARKKDGISKIQVRPIQMKTEFLSGNKDVRA